jgi:HTH-type transcriptional regulator/antitoxin HigA
MLASAMPDDDEKYQTPGQLVSDLLTDRGWSNRVLAIVLQADETGLNKIIGGKRPVNAELAIKIGSVLGVAPKRLLDLQSKYDLAHAEIKVRPDPGAEIRGRLFGDLPITEMLRRGWLTGPESVRDIEAVSKALTRFFGVRSVNEIEILPHAAKKTRSASPITPTQLAWLYRVKSIAEEMLVAEYSPGSVRNAVSRLSKLLASAEEARKVPRILAEAGIRFTIVESLPGAKIDGVCLWLDDSSPVVGMTLRHDRIDNFWFVLRHELEHIAQLHGRAAIMLDTELEGARAGVGGDVTDEERIANSAAAEFCVPQKALDSFIARKGPVFTERDIIGFARVQQLHPGLVAGQLQHRTGRYDRFRDHLVKIRSIVRQGSMVDGWGDVAPTET